MPRKQKRPTCINHGCNKPVTHCGTRWRPHCIRCHKAGYGNGTLKEGVTPFKTGKCSNQDGHLGFPCPISYRKAPWVIGYTHIDHIDGDYFNNIIENVQELCQPCHVRKGMMEGDYKKRYKND